MRHARSPWLVDLLGHEQICCVTSCEFDEKRATKPKFVAQSRPALYFSQQLSSTHNECFCCATSWSRKVRNGKHRRIAMKQCCATSWRFLYLVFRRLNNRFKLNTDKTKSTFVTGARLRAKIDSFDQMEVQTSKGDVLETTTSHKLLGVYIDLDLSFTRACRTFM